MAHGLDCFARGVVQSVFSSAACPTAVSVAGRAGLVSFGTLSLLH